MDPFTRADESGPGGLGRNVPYLEPEVARGRSVPYLEPDAVDPQEQVAAPSTTEVPCADSVLLQREREALRIIVAAVVAQQAALTDEEIRLEQRAQTLVHQETQLAKHLDQRQDDLDEQVERLQQERTDFEAEREAGRAALAEDARQRAELQRDRQRLAKDRQRLKDLQHRIWRRHQRQTQQQQADLTRRLAEVSSREQQLLRERERIQSFYERINGELELSRRTLHQDAEDLALAQQRWHEGIELDRQDQARRRSELETEQRCWRDEQARLQRECAGLEARIHHLRERLIQPTPEVIHLVSETTTVPSPSPDWPEQLRELAGILSDQRARLAEQWQRLLQIEQAWQEDRLEALADLEKARERLDLREQSLAEKERHASELDVRRNQLESWQARLMLERSAWEARRDELRNQLEERERLLGLKQEQLDSALREAERRAQDERANLQRARSRSEEARLQAAELWRECDDLREQLLAQQRRLAAEALALEQYRCELVHQTADVGQADSRINKLRVHEQNRLDEDYHNLDREREELRQQRERLESESHRLDRFEDELLSRQERWTRQVVDLERQTADLQQRETRQLAELRQTRARQAIQERQLHQLREELERLARSLMDDSPPSVREAA